MGFVKRTNKKYDYTPRYYEGEGNPYKIERSLDQFRKNTAKREGIKVRFNNAMEDLRTPQNKQSTKIMLVIITFLVLVFLFIIDFDLSIFSSQK